MMCAILGLSFCFVLPVVLIKYLDLKGEFFDGREPNREATTEELKMPQYNAQRIVPRRIQQNQPS